MPSAEAGQKFTISPDDHEDLTPKQLEKTYESDKVKGEGPDAFCTVKDESGVVLTYRGAARWIRATELRPAQAPPGERPRVVEVEKETVLMSAETKLMNLATTIAKTKGIRLADAAKEASLQLKDEFDEYRGGSPALAARASVTSLNVIDRPGVQRLRAETQRVAREEGISFDDAADKVLCDRLPDAGATRFELRVQQLKAGGLDDTTAFLRANREDPAGAEAYRLAGL